MFTGQMTAALFAIAIVSSLIVASGGFVGPAYAHTTTKNKVKQHHQYLLSLPVSPALDKDKPISTTAHNANPDNSAWTIGDVKSVPTKEMYYWRQTCNT